MADIRINALATTAASTASDDFIAVDGSANGTRKLNAYSPTFGGNLTVSGTTASTFGPISRTNGTNATVLTLSDNLTGVSTTGYGLQIRGTSNNGGCVSAIGFENGGTGTNNETQFSVYTQNAANALTKQFTIGSTGNATLAGNLTVSGGLLTLNNATESYVELKIAGTTKGYLDQLPSTLNVLGMSGVDVDIYAGGNNPANRVAKFAASGIATTLYGNLTVSGTGGISIGSATFTGGRALTATTGSGNSVSARLLQTGVADWEIKNVATTGALSFQQSGTDYALLTATGNLLIGTTSDGGQKLQVSGTAYVSGNLTVGGVQNVIGSASPTANFPLRINQGATDATVTMDIANVSSGTSAAANIQLQSDAGTSFLRQHSAAHSVWPNYLLLGGSDKIAISTGSTSDGIELMTGFTTRVNITTATTTISNTLAINNTVQTAAGVASTHKVTISIGGTTYYLLATNV